MSADLTVEEDTMSFATFSRSSLLTPGEYVQLTTDQRENIRRVQIVPPRLGGGFGRLRVTYERPVRVRHER